MAEYIDRKKAEILFRDARLALKPEGCKDWNEYITRDTMLMNAEQLIHIFPAADVRPVVRGKWIEHNYDPEYLSCDFSCSRCGLYLDEYYFGEGQWPGKTDHYFCPNCGADMREENNG